MLSFLCLCKIKTCQIAVCNNLIWWNEIIVYHFTTVDLSTMVKWKKRHHFIIVDYYILKFNKFFFFLLPSITYYCRLTSNASRECNFAMGTILGKDFPQALVRTVQSTCAFGRRHKCSELYAQVLVENPFPRLSPWQN